MVVHSLCSTGDPRTHVSHFDVLLTASCLLSWSPTQQTIEIEFGRSRQINSGELMHFFIRTLFNRTLFGPYYNSLGTLIGIYSNRALFGGLTCIS